MLCVHVTDQFDNFVQIANRQSQSRKMENSSSKCFLTISLALYFKYPSNVSHNVAGETKGTNMKLLIHKGDDEPCVNSMKVYNNAIFLDSFIEISIPIFPGMKESYCINYCIRTSLCNAIFIAKSKEYDYGENSNVFYSYWYKFDWCKVYTIQRKDINVTDLTLDVSAPVISTWPEGGALPDQSELTFIQFDGCCPNKCSNETICKNTVGGSFLCLNVYLEFDDNMIPDAIVGNYQLSDGMTG